MDRSLIDEIAEVEDDHWWYEGRRQIIAGVLDRLELKKGSKILEAGCGSGGNLELLANYGSVFAFEPDPYAFALARSRDVGQIREGSLPDDIPFEEKFEVVLALDVIEHIDDDIEAVKTLVDVLTPGGVMILTVPAYQWMWSEHDEVNEHRRRYTRSVLARTMDKAGVNVQHVSYFNTLLFPAACFQRLVANKFFRRKSTALQIPSDGINRLLTGVLASERFVIFRPRLPFGLSILALGTKL